MIETSQVLTLEGDSGGRKRLAAVALISILAPLNSTMIAVALPSIVDDFDADISFATWLITAYLVVMASVQPLAGKLGDTMGRRSLIIGALAVFAAVSIGASIAPSVSLVLLFRVGQALTISIALSNGFAVMRETVPSDRRGRTFGLIEAATGLSAAAGPLVGGGLVSVFDWRAIFLVNIPFVALALLFAWQTLPRDRRTGAFSGFDYTGAALLPVTLVAIAVFFLLLTRGGSPALIVAIGLTATALAGVLIRQELRHPNPVFQPRFYRIRGFAAPSVGVGTSNLAMYSLLLVVPLLLTARGGFTEFKIGLVLTSLSVGMALLTPFGGRLADRFGRRNPVIIGMTISAAATIPLVSLGSGLGVAILVLSLCFFGLGLGLSNAGMRASAVESIPVRYSGAGAGAYSTSRYFGSIIGSAILAGMIGANRTNTEGIDQVFIVVTLAAFAAVAAAIVMQSRPDKAE